MPDATFLDSTELVLNMRPQHPYTHSCCAKGQGAVRYVVTGPVLGAASVQWDLLKAQPYSGYDNTTSGSPPAFRHPPRSRHARARYRRAHAGLRLQTTFASSMLLLCGSRLWTRRYAGAAIAQLRTLGQIRRFFRQTSRLSNEQEPNQKSSPGSPSRSISSSRLCCTAARRSSFIAWWAG
jgi:hypothetical protein